MRIDGAFPSFSDDDRYLVYNEGFTGVSVADRDGSNKKVIYKVLPISLHPNTTFMTWSTCSARFWRGQMLIWHLLRKVTR